MKVQYTKKDDKKAKFTVTGIDFVFANAIRRAILTYVPSMAVEKITLYENTSPLYEEMIAQRIGLIPLTTDLKTYTLPSECKCNGEGCARCQATFILEKTGPCTVYSGDMKSRDPKIKPVFDKIPITKMRDGQAIKMEMVARLGLMTEHAKFQSSLVSYKQVGDDEFYFIVESYNNIPTHEIVEIALDGLEKNIAELEHAFLNPVKERTKKAKKVIVKVEAAAKEEAKAEKAEAKEEKKKGDAKEEKAEKKAKKEKAEAKEKTAKPKKAAKKE